MKILQTNFFGDQNLGLYARASEKFCLIGNFPQNVIEKIKSVLKVRIYHATASNTDFAGIFFSINSNGIVAPNILTDAERENLKEVAKDLGLNILFLKSKFTAIGNLILCNDRGGIVSKNLKKVEFTQIMDCLDVDLGYGRIGKIDIVGAVGVATNKGCIVHRDATDEEIKFLEEILKVDVDIGTANFGSPFLGSCMFANSKGLVVGQSTTGPEITRIMESLKLI